MTTEPGARRRRPARRRPAKATAPRAEASGDRLNKVLSRAGVCSRRAADRLIAEGQVTVNGRTVTELGTRVDPTRDAIKVGGRRLAAAPARHVYLMLNKPRGYVTTLRDPEGRPTVSDLLRGVGRRVYPVGRLDFHSEGLLLLTDDGDLGRDLMHPASEVPKTYRVKVRGKPDARALTRLRRGVRLGRETSAPARVRVLRGGPPIWLEITVTEGKKHQVRRMCQAVGHPVQKLRRVAYGGVELGDLPAGEIRPLRAAEVKRLLAHRRSGPGPV